MKIMFHIVEVPRDISWEGKPTMGGQLDSCRLGKAEAVGTNMDVLPVSGIT